MPVVNGVNFVGLFDDPNAPGAPFRAALADFQQIDQPLGANDPVAWGLAPAAARLGNVLTTYLGQTPGTVVQVVGMGGRMPVGSTQLFGQTGPVGGGGGWDNLTDNDANAMAAWLVNNPALQFRILVEVKLSPSTQYQGAAVEILAHELSAHAEPFADDIRLIAAGAAGNWETEAQQHTRLGTGDPRYQLLGSRYCTLFLGPDEAPRFRVRRQQDTTANSILAPGVN